MIFKSMAIYVMSAMSRGQNGRDISSKSGEPQTVKAGAGKVAGTWASGLDRSGFETLGGREQATHPSGSSL